MPDRLNNLNGKAWKQHCRSWFEVNPKPRGSKVIQHPATFPPEIPKRFIKLFTKKGQWVIDPFCGTGTSVAIAQQLGRNAIGIELNAVYARLARQVVGTTLLPTKTNVWRGNSLEIGKMLDERREQFNLFNLCVTSPPYWNVLNTSRGGSDSQHSQRKERDLPLTYSNSEDDLGDEDNYELFLEKLVSVFTALWRYMAIGGHVVAILQNVRAKDGKTYYLAWDFARKISDFWGYEPLQEEIWCQGNKTLGIWGYPTTYVTTTCHHYCLVFKAVTVDSNVPRSLPP